MVQSNDDTNIYQQSQLNDQIRTSQHFMVGFSMVFPSFHGGMVGGQRGICCTVLHHAAPCFIQDEPPSLVFDVSYCEGKDVWYCLIGLDQKCVWWIILIFQVFAHAESFSMPKLPFLKPYDVHVYGHVTAKELMGQQRQMVLWSGSWSWTANHGHPSFRGGHVAEQLRCALIFQGCRCWVRTPCPDRSPEMRVPSHCMQSECFDELCIWNAGGKIATDPTSIASLKRPDSVFGGVSYLFTTKT